MLVKTKDEENHLEDLKETFETLRRYPMKLNPSKCVFGVSSRKFLGFMVFQKGIEANLDKIKAVLEMTPPRTIKEVQSLTGRVAALNRFVSRATVSSLLQNAEKSVYLDGRMPEIFRRTQGIPDVSTFAEPFPTRRSPLFVLSGLPNGCQLSPHQGGRGHPAASILYQQSLSGSRGKISSNGETSTSSRHRY